MNLLKQWFLIKFLLFFSGIIPLLAQPVEKEIFLWKDFAEFEVITVNKRQIIPQKYRAISLDINTFKAIIERSPMRFSSESKDQKTRIELPMPNGEMKFFDIVKAPILHPDLAARFPEIQSFAGQGIDDPSAYLRFDITPKGFHAMILSGNHNTVFIDPYAVGDTEHYISYFKKDFVKQNEDSFYCEVEPSSLANGAIEAMNTGDVKTLLTGDCILRKYRLALACTGEYAQFHGGNTPSVLAAMNTTMTRVIGLYERDASITMELIPNNDQLIFLDAVMDPYTNNSGGTMLGENQETIDNIIGGANYDIGHVFSTGGGGVASLNSPCSSSRKAQGVTGLGSPVGDPFDIDYVAHEMGHQYGGNHTQNNDCQRNSSTSVEPGSAATIMGYAGICSPNIQNNSDDYFHIINLREIALNVSVGTSSTCYEELVSNNNAPTADAGLDYTIPVGTPFVLTGTADDIDDADAVTSTWEQMDAQVAVMPPSGQSAGGPLFRSVNLTASPIRTFPRLPAIVNNTNPVWEVLPEVARTMNFTFSVRDNNPGHGCTADDDMELTVSGNAGPFLITQPDESNINWEVGQYTEVAWEVANTDTAPVNCTYVNISLSVDGGFTYPYLLAQQTPNTGSAFVTVPDALTNQARIRVEAYENVFFDISNNNFSIVPTTLPGYTLNLNPMAQNICLPATVEINIETDSLLGFNNEVTFTLTEGLPEGTVVNFDQNPMVPGQTGILTLNLTDVAESGLFEVVMQAVAEGVDTTYRAFRLDLTRNDFSELAMELPENGENGIILTSDFSWNPVQDALTYDLEISTSPLFEDSVIISAFDLTDSQFTPTDFFDESTLYFWRIRPENTCGKGAWLDPFVFQTVNSVCTPYIPEDLPINISGSGTPTIESVLFIESSGIISDVNIPFMKAIFQPVSSLRITLVSPAGTEVILFDQNCYNTQDLRIGFDDNSPFDITCPPDDGIVFRPVESLSAFEGEDIQGEWIIRIKVVESGFGASGALEEWSIEFCASTSTESPFIVKNDTLFVPPSGFNYITDNELEAEDNDSDNVFALEYTIVTPPTKGTLYYIDEPLGAGSTFRQSGVNANFITYVHNGGDEIFDHFTFLVRDGEGGLSPAQVFNIKMDENTVVGTKEAALDLQVDIFPNPAKNALFINFDSSLEGKVHLSLLNTQGQMLLQKNIYSGIQNLLDVSGIASGMYFLQIQAQEGSFLKKVVVEK